LDRVHGPARHWRMAHDTIHYLVLHRRDPSCNMARYYVLSLAPSPYWGCGLDPGVGPHWTTGPAQG
jgi:hypothetical protein